MTTFIDNLTKEQILNEPLPLRQLLEDSLYYPASNFDGGVIKHCNTQGRALGIQSFVYCDYSVSHWELKKDVNLHIRGYKVYADRSIKKEELLLGADTTRPIAPFFATEEEQRKYQNIIRECRPFCHWFVLERLDDFDESHGPKRISLLFICAEGIATYYQLYNANHIAPKVLAIIQEGAGWGGNWTFFSDRNSPFDRIARSNPQGMPRYIFYGGIGLTDFYQKIWKGYHKINEIYDYYGPDDGYVALFSSTKG